MSTAEPPAAHPRRRTFGPVVLLGLAAGVLGAVAGTNAWVSGRGAESAPGLAATSSGELAASPLGTALALVVLACWGVVLVTRGSFRRVVAGLGALTALGYAATVAAAPWLLRDHLVDEVRRLAGVELDGTSLTGWWWAAVLAAVVLVATALAAVAWARHWPEMGTRYDAPTDAPSGAGSAPGRAGTPVPETNLDMWKALDEGRDPTE